MLCSQSDHNQSVDDVRTQIQLRTVEVSSLYS